MYSSPNEFMDCYVDGKLNEFNTSLYENYIDLNFYDEDYFNCQLLDQYKDNCDCDYEDSDDETCKCTKYYHDEFMYDKIPMFPKNMKLQAYYDKIFPKRIFKNKIYYYLII